MLHLAISLIWPTTLVSSVVCEVLFKYLQHFTLCASSFATSLLINSVVICNFSSYFGSSVLSSDYFPAESHQLQLDSNYSLYSSSETTQQLS